MTKAYPVVSAVGIYIPEIAVRTKRATLPVCNGDEDATTLTIQAANECLGVDDRASVDRLYIAMGNAPVTDVSLGEVIREALGLSPRIQVSVSLGDPSGAIAMLNAALDAVNLGHVSTALVVGSEAGDSRDVGAASVALLIEAAPAKGIRIGVQRSIGSIVYGSRRDAVGNPLPNDARYLESGAVATLVAVTEVDETIGSLPNTLAVGGAVPIAEIEGLGDHDLVSVGNFGVASILLSLVVGASSVDGVEFGALDVAPGRSLLVRAQVDSSRTGWPLPPALLQDRPTDKYEPAASPVLSLPTNSPFFARSAGELLRLEGQKCLSCGHVTFPASQRPICDHCQASSWTPHRLARQGHVYTFTVNKFLPNGFGRQMVMILGELEDGNRYWAPASGISDSEVEIGLPVTLQVRRFTDDGRIPTYAMKFTHGDGGAILPRLNSAS